MVADLTHETLTIRASAGDGGAVKLEWIGKSKSRDPGKLLTPYINEAIREAAERGAKLEMHFEGVEFFNSATVMVLIQAVHVAKTLGVAARLVYAGHLEWQRLSFEPMRVFESAGGLEIAATAAGATAQAPPGPA